MLVPLSLALVPTVVAVAVGTPTAQDTTMVTVSCPSVNVTWALVAGPRTTPVDPKPCWGLHDTKYARASAHLATTVGTSASDSSPSTWAGDGD